MSALSRLNETIQNKQNEFNDTVTISGKLYIEKETGKARTGHAPWGGYPTFDETLHPYIVTDPKRDFKVEDVFIESFQLGMNGTAWLRKPYSYTGLPSPANPPYADFFKDTPVAVKDAGKANLLAETIFSEWANSMVSGDTTVYAAADPGEPSYTSVEWYGGAILEKAWNDHYGLTGSDRKPLGDIFNSEIGDKIDANIFYYVSDTDTRYSNVVRNCTIQTVTTSDSNVANTVTGFIHDAEVEGKSGRDWYKLGDDVVDGAKFHCGLAYAHASSNAFANMGRLVGRSGLSPSGDRIINASVLAKALKKHKTNRDMEGDYGYYDSRAETFGFFGHVIGIDNLPDDIFEQDLRSATDAETNTSYIRERVVAPFTCWLSRGTGGSTVIYSAIHDASMLVTGHLRDENKTFELNVRQVLLNAFINDLTEDPTGDIGSDFTAVLESLRTNTDLFFEESDVTAAVAGRPAILQTGHATKKIPALSVVVKKNGNHHEVFKGVSRIGDVNTPPTADSPAYMFSVGKLPIGLLYMKMLSDGILSEGTKIGDVFSDFDNIKIKVIRQTKQLTVVNPF